MSSGHRKRIITGAIGVLIVLLVVLKGGRGGTGLLVGLASVLGLLEYYRLALPKASAFSKGIGVVFALSLVAAFFAGSVSLCLGLFVLAFVTFAVISLVRFGPEPSGLGGFSRQVVGLIYVPFFLGYVILVRDGANGAVWTLFLLAVVFTGDTAAYYVGKTLGRHKLTPKISPGKTVEGSLGGLGGSCLAGLLFKVYLLPELTWPLCFGLAFCLGIMGQIGDLFESMFKRSVRIKDSGRLLPGHGGVLDRIDGLIFAAPVLYYFKIYVF